MRSFIVAVALLVAAVPASAAPQKTKVGNFNVITDDDPFNDRGTYIALVTNQAGDSLGVRCLNRLDFAFSITGQSSVGDEVQLKLRVDNAPVKDLSGEIISAGTNRSPGIVEVPEPDAVKSMRDAKQIAIRATLAGVSSTLIFKVQNINAVLEGAHKTCQLPYP